MKNILPNGYPNLNSAGSGERRQVVKPGLFGIAVVQLLP